MTKYGDDVVRCAQDGAALVPADTFAHVDKDLSPGEVVGEYQIEGKLGEGGFGTVFRAVHPVIGKTAAIKVLNRQCSANPQMVSRFVAEARAVNQIRHRNIIDIFSFGQLPDGRQYYVMELLDGVTFDAYLAQHARLTFAQAFPILRGIARALDAAHAKDILHRDLKPENVFLVFDEDGGVQPKLLDFGLVKLLAEVSGEHKTKTGTPMGTPYYMSPEQSRGKDVDRRTDVYAFGALTFQVLTGKVPFDGDSTMDVLMKHIAEPPPRPSTVCGELAPALDDAILAMLAKEPSSRPTSVGQGLEALAAAAGQAGVAGPASLPVPPPPKAPVGVPFQGIPTIPTGTGPTLTPAAQPGPRVTPDAARAPGSGAAPLAQTFLPSEADVAASSPGSLPRPARRSPARLIAAVLVVGLGASVAAAVAFTSRRPPAAVASADAPPSASAQGRAADRPSAEIASASAGVGALAAGGASEASAAARTVAIRLEGAPRGATATLDGRDLGPLPGPFAVPAGVESRITVTAKSFRAREVVVTPSADATVKVALEKQPAAPAAGGKPAVSPDLIDFDKR